MATKTTRAARQTGTPAPQPAARRDGERGAALDVTGGTSGSPRKAKSKETIAVAVESAIAAQEEVDAVDLRKARYRELDRLGKPELLTILAGLIPGKWGRVAKADVVTMIVNAELKAGKLKARPIAGGGVPALGLDEEGAAAVAEQFAAVGSAFQAETTPEPIFDERKCRVCGCTDDDCSGCIAATGYPCAWVSEDLCSRCNDEAVAAELADDDEPDTYAEATEDVDDLVAERDLDSDPLDVDVDTPEVAGRVAAAAAQLDAFLDEREESAAAGAFDPATHAIDTGYVVRLVGEPGEWRVDAASRNTIVKSVEPRFGLRPLDRVDTALRWVGARDVATFRPPWADAADAVATTLPPGQASGATPAARTEPTGPGWPDDPDAAAPTGRLPLEPADHAWLNDVADQVQDVEVKWVVPNPANPRKSFDHDELVALGASIEAHGLIQAIVVRPVRVPWNGASVVAYELIAGERRWRAAKLAGLETLRAHLRLDVDDKLALQLMLVENLKRADLNAVDEARGYAELNRVVGMTQAEIAAAVNLSQAAIGNRIRILGLPADVLDLVATGELSRSHAIALARFVDFPKVATYLAKKAVERKLTAKAFEKGMPLSDDRDVAYQLPYDLNGWLKTVETLHEPFKTECAACPWGAFFPTNAQYGRSTGYCLRPEHAVELEGRQRELEERRRAEEKAAVEAAKKAAAKAVPVAVVAPPPTASPEAAIPDIATLAGKVEELREDDLPAGCGPGCDCRGVARRAGKIIPICVKPGRFAHKKRAEEAAAKAHGTAVADARVAWIRAHFDNLVGKRVAPAVGDRELELALGKAIAEGHDYIGSRGRHIREALMRHRVLAKGDLNYQVGETAKRLAGKGPMAVLAVCEGLLVNDVVGHGERVGPDRKQYGAKALDKPELFLWYFDGADAPNLPSAGQVDVTTAAATDADGPIDPDAGVDEEAEAVLEEVELLLPYLPGRGWGVLGVDQQDDGDRRVTVTLKRGSDGAVVALPFDADADDPVGDFLEALDHVDDAAPDDGTSGGGALARSAATAGVGEGG